MMNSDIVCPKLHNKYFDLSQGLYRPIIFKSVCELCMYLKMHVYSTKKSADF